VALARGPPDAPRGEIWKLKSTAGVYTKVGHVLTWAAVAAAETAAAAAAVDKENNSYWKQEQAI